MQENLTNLMKLSVSAKEAVPNPDVSKLLINLLNILSCLNITYSLLAASYRAQLRSTARKRWCLCSLSLQVVECLLQSQPDSVANHITAHPISVNVSNA